MASFLDLRFKHLKDFDSADRLLIIADVHAEMELEYKRVAISFIEASRVQLSMPKTRYSETQK